MLRCLIVLIPALFTAFPILGQDIEPEDVKPGIVAKHTAGSASITRLESTIALNIPADESIHPALSSRGLQSHWEGTIGIFRAGKYHFEANLIGHVKVTVGSTKVLEDVSKDGHATGAEVELKSGLYPIVVDFDANASPARLELLWKAPQARLEPLPYAVLGHLPAKNQISKEESSIEYGRFLFEELACHKCHAPSQDIKSSGIPDRSGPNLSEIAGRTTPSWVSHWLADPSKIRPQTIMPKLFADDEQGKMERQAVTAYLSSLGKPTSVGRVPRAQDYLKSTNNGRVLFTSLGCIACHPSSLPKQVTTAAVYGFDGSAAAGEQYLLGALGDKFNEVSLAKYLQTPQVTHPHGRMPSMNLSQIEAQDIARYLCLAKEKDQPAEPALGEKIPMEWLEKKIPEAKLREQIAKERKTAVKWQLIGKEVFASKGCGKCHAVDNSGKTLPVSAKIPTLEEIRAVAKPGCLEAASKTGVVYNLVKDRQEALLSFLKSKQSWPGAKSSSYQSQVAIKRFNCLNCHQRDGEGGLPTELADAMKKYEKGENVDDVRPPVLTGVGHKLRTSWVKKVLLEAGRSRPWASLRMPQFGEQIGFVVEGLSRIEGIEPDDTIQTVKPSKELIEAGRLMIGKNGLGCISCHDIAGIPNTGTRGPDLATVNQRVRYDWYRRWLEVPQKMSPNTRMPQVFVDGVSPLPKLLGGSSEKQADAMWAYMALGPTMPLPAGLEPPKGLTINVATRPEVLRTFLPEVGSRGIAVGFPGHINMAFDAATCRLAYAWSGNFLDASPIWANRGGAPAKLLGTKIWSSRDVNPWAITSSKEPPDFQARAGNPAYGAKLPDLQPPPGEMMVGFEGYALDPQGNPSFRYKIKGESAEPLRITEKPQPLGSDFMNGLQRNFTLQVPEGQQAWLLVGTSKTSPKWIESPTKVTSLEDRKTLPAEAPIGLAEEGDRFVVYQTVGLSCSATWLVRKSGDSYELLLKISADPTKKETVGLKSWIAPKLDETTLQAILEAK